MDDLDHDRPQVGFTWARLQELHRHAGRPYLEFLRSASLSAGLYVIPAGGIDEQVPHAEDELYVVIAGGSLFSAGEDTREIRAGDVLFVAAGVPHRFHDISEELRLIVVCAPREGSNLPPEHRNLPPVGSNLPREDQNLPPEDRSLPAEGPAATGPRTA